MDAVVGALGEYTRVACRKLVRWLRAALASCERQARACPRARRATVAARCCTVPPASARASCCARCCAPAACPPCTSRRTWCYSLKRKRARASARDSPRAVTRLHPGSGSPNAPAPPSATQRAFPSRGNSTSKTVSLRSSYSPSRTTSPMKRPSWKRVDNLGLANLVTVRPPARRLGHGSPDRLAEHLRAHDPAAGLEYVKDGCRQALMVAVLPLH